MKNEELKRDFRRSDMRPVMRIQGLILVMWVVQWIVLVWTGSPSELGLVFANRPWLFLVFCLSMGTIMPAFSYEAGKAMLRHEKRVTASPRDKFVSFRNMAVILSFLDWYRAASLYLLSLKLSGVWDVPVFMLAVIGIIFLISIVKHAFIALFADKLAVRWNRVVPSKRIIADLRMMPV